MYNMVLGISRKGSFRIQGAYERQADILIAANNIDRTANWFVYEDETGKRSVGHADLLLQELQSIVGESFATNQLPLASMPLTMSWVGFVAKNTNGDWDAVFADKVVESGTLFVVAPQNDLSLSLIEVGKLANGSPMLIGDSSDLIEGRPLFVGLTPPASIQESIGVVTKP